MEGILVDFLSQTRGTKETQAILTTHSEMSAWSRLNLHVRACSLELHTVVHTGVCWGDVTDADGEVRVVSPCSI